MKKTMPLLLAFLFVCNSLIAQHCPFDGGAIVVIKLTAADGKPITRLTHPLFLTERNNPIPDSCTYAAGLLNLCFDNPQLNLVKKYKNSWEARASLYIEDCSFNQPGYYVVVLNQPELHCMVKRNNDFIYQDRHFDIRLLSDTQNTLLASVPADKIYSLCTANGKWTRIEAIEIQSKE